MVFNIVCGDLRSQVKDNPVSERGSKVLLTDVYLKALRKEGS